MGILQDFRREEIAALLSRSAPRDAIGRIIAFSAVELLRKEGVLAGSYRRNVQNYQTAAGLAELLRRGSISIEEANAYFALSFGLEGLFRRLPTTRQQQEAARTEVELLETGETTVDVATNIIDASAEVQEAGGSGGLQPVTVDLPDLPANYSAAAVGSALRQGFDEVEQRLSEIKSGKISFAPGSIDGAALRPGTVSSTKLSADDLSRRVQQWPTSTQAVELDIIPDAAVDRWQVAGNLAFAGGGSRAVRGPGRVVRVRTAKLAPDYRRPTGGPMRYRIVTPGMRFGLAAVRPLQFGAHGGAGDTIYELTYATVIRGIPYFGERPPEHIRVVWVSGPDAQSNGVVPAGPAPRGFFHGAARTTFGSSAWTLFEPYADLTGAVTAPSAGELDQASGFSVGLILGDDWRAVFAQLNGAPCPFGELTGAPAPRGSRPIASPVVVRATTPGPPMVTSYVLDTLAGSVEDVVIGIPFRPEDCDVLKPNLESKTFSVVVEALVNRQLTGIEYRALLGAGRDMRPGAWWTSGVRVAPRGQRRTLVDMVVW